MQNELEALGKNNTWILIELLQGKKAIASKWVYRLKYKLNGSLDRYKVRLVTKDYNQLPGVDFHDSFQLVAKVVTVRMFLAISTTNNWYVH